MNHVKSICDMIPLNNGYQIPCVGFGTYKVPAAEARASVSSAIQAGYRHIDTAAYYQNEAEVGQAIRESGLPRESFFLTSKVWNTDRGYDRTRTAFEQSVRLLGTDYLDLYLIHWPANYYQFGEQAKDLNAETWRALEDLYREGRIRAIGLSNFLPHHIDALLERAKVKPMVDQVELHPGWLQRSVLRYCRDHGIVVEAWSPLGRNAVLTHPVITAAAEKYQRTAAQICIRWVLQHGAIPLPKSVTPERIRSNTELFDFVLTDEDMERLDALANIGGQCARPDDVTF